MTSIRWHLSSKLRISPVHRLSSSLGDGRRETQASGRSDLRLVFSQVVGPADQAGRPTARLLIGDILGADFSVGAFIVQAVRVRVEETPGHHRAYDDRVDSLDQSLPQPLGRSASETSRFRFLRRLSRTTFSTWLLPPNFVISWRPSPRSSRTSSQPPRLIGSVPRTPPRPFLLRLWLLI